MNKQTKLILGQACLFLAVFIFMAYLIVEEKMPLFYQHKAQEEIDEYYQENYQELKNIKASEIEYTLKDKSYSVTYYDNDHKDLFFTLTFKDDTVTSDYEENYVHGRTLLKSREDTIVDKIKANISNDYYTNVSVDFLDLDEYNQDRQEVILEEEDLSSYDYYNIIYTIEVDNLEDPQNDVMINQLLALGDQNNLNPRQYIFKLKLDNEIEERIFEKGADLTWTIVSSVK